MRVGRRLGDGQVDETELADAWVRVDLPCEIALQEKMGSAWLSGSSRMKIERGGTHHFEDVRHNALGSYPTVVFQQVSCCV